MENQKLTPVTEKLTAYFQQIKQIGNNLFNDTEVKSYFENLECAGYIEEINEALIAAENATLTALTEGIKINLTNEGKF